MAEYIAASAAVLMVPSIKGFKQRLKAALDTVDESVKVGVDLNKQALAKVEAELAAFKKAVEKDDINLKVKLDTQGVTKQITEIRREHDNLASDFQKGLLLNVKVAGAAALPALANAFGALDQSAVQLGQSMALLPGIIAGVASVAGTLAVGVHGVSAAFKAYGTAVKDSAADAQRSKDAIRELNNANRDLSVTTRDAKRNLEDLNQQLKGAPLDEADAVLNLKEAYAQLADVSGKTGLQRQRDELNVEKAQQALATTRTRATRLIQDVNTANAQGVANNPAVLDALDRQTKAQEGLNTASKGGAAVAAALNKLSPNAQDFVIKVQSMSGAFNDFKNSVQDKLFNGLGDSVLRLGKGLPVVQAGFTNIAQALNGSIKRVLDDLGSSANLGFLQTIFQNTANAASLLGDAVKPVVNAFLQLASSGSSFLPGLVQGFTDLANRFAAFISTAAKDGSIDRWITVGIQAFKDLGTSIGNIVTIMGTVSDAFGEAGGKGFLGTLAEATTKLSDFLKSPKGHEELIDLFHRGQEVMKTFRIILEGLPDVWRAFSGAVQTVNSVVSPILGTLLSLIGKFPNATALVLAGFVAWKTIAPIVKGVSVAMDFTRGAMDKFQGSAYKASEAVMSSKGGKKGAGFVGALSNLSDFVGSGGPVMIGIGAMATLLVGRYVTAQNDARDAAQGHADALANVKSQLSDISGLLTEQGLIDKLNQLGSVDLSSGPGQLPGLNREDQAKHANVVQTLKDNNVSDADIKKYFTDAPTRDKVNNQLLDKIQKSTEKSEYYQKNGAELAAHGVDLRTLAKAIGFDPEATKKFDAAQPSLGNNGVSLADLRSQHKLGPLDASSISGALGAGGVPAPIDQGGHDAAVALGVLNKDVQAQGEQGGVTVRNNQIVRGNVQFKPGANLFRDLGGSPHPGPGGSAVIDIPGGPTDFLPGGKQAALAQKIRDNGGQINPLAQGGAYGWEVTLTPERAQQYVVPGAATGEMVSGPGTGTSDSILRRVSNGEAITRASQVAKNPALFHGLNSGAIDPASLPKFALGGGVGLGGGFKLDPFVIPSGPGVHNIPNPTGPISYTGSTFTAPGSQSVPGQIGPIPVPAGVVPKPAPVPAPAPAPVPASVDPGVVPGVGTPNLTPGFAGPGPAGDVPLTSTNAATLPAEAGFNPAPVVDAPPAPTGIDGNLAQFTTEHPWLANFLGVNASSAPADGSGGSTGGPPTALGFFGDLGSIFVSAVLGFFGINPAIATSVKKSLGLVAKGIGSPGDPQVQSILDAQGNPVPDVKEPGLRGFIDRARGKPPGVPGQATDSSTVAPVFGTNGAPVDFNVPSGQNENKLQLDTIRTERAMEQQFSPFIGSIGGFREDPKFPNEHPSGKAIDVMLKAGNTEVGHQQGDQMLQYVLANAKSLGVDYVLYKQRQWNPDGSSTPMEDRGSATDNHQDHLHIHTAGGGYPGAAVAATAGTPASVPNIAVAGVKGNWDAIAQNESHGNWHINTGNGHFGGLQFTQSSWDAAKPDGAPARADLATPEQQKAAANKLLAMQGPGAWPNTWVPAAATGGMLSGPGTGTSDSILARVSHGEYITRAAQVAKNPGLFHGLNSGAIDPAAFPKFALGGEAGKGLDLKRNPDGTVKTTHPGPSPFSFPGGKSTGGSKGWFGAAGAQASGAAKSKDGADRAAAGANPGNAQHGLKALDEGIDGAATAIGNIASTAASAAAAGATMGAGGGAGGLIGPAIQGATQIGSGVAKGLVNVVSSALVGTVTPGTTAGAYGAPLTPAAPGGPGGPQGPKIVNNYGDIHTASYDQFYKGQQRREQQQQSPQLNALGRR